MRPESALKRFEEFLRDKKLRMTKQRRDILLLAWQTHAHFTAEEMYGWVRESDAKASRATVYRTLALLEEGGFVSSLNDGQGQVLYEHILGHSHHDHMVCLGCRRIIEFRNDEIERQQVRMADKHNFELVRHTLRLEGYCAGCQARRPRRGDSAGEAKDGAGGRAASV